MVACLGRSVEIVKFVVVGMTRKREILRGLEQYGMCPAQMKRVDAADISLVAEAGSNVC
jgi:hypothetical protein